MDREEIIQEIRLLDPEELRHLALFLDKVAPNPAGLFQPGKIPGQRGSRKENPKRDKEPGHPASESEK